MRLAFAIPFVLSLAFASCALPARADVSVCDTQYYAYCVEIGGSSYGSGTCASPAPYHAESSHVGAGVNSRQVGVDAGWYCLAGPYGSDGAFHASGVYADAIAFLAPNVPLAAAGFSWYAYHATFPGGSSDACDTIVYFALGATAPPVVQSLGCPAGDPPALPALP